MKNLIIQANKSLSNEKGNVSWIIIGITTFVLAIPILFIIFDSFYISFVERKYTEAIDDINRDVYQLIDIQRTAFNVDIEVMDEAAARLAFEEQLDLRFGEDGLSINGPITIDQFEVIQLSDLPVDDRYGTELTNPGIISEVTIPIKTRFLGIEADKKVLVTSEVYR